MGNCQVWMQDELKTNNYVAWTLQPSIQNNHSYFGQISQKYVFSENSTFHNIKKTLAELNSDGLTLSCLAKIKISI